MLRRHMGLHITNVLHSKIVFIINLIFYLRGLEKDYFACKKTYFNPNVLDRLNDIRI